MTRPWAFFPTNSWAPMNCFRVGAFNAHRHSEISQKTWCAGLRRLVDCPVRSAASPSFGLTRKRLKKPGKTSVLPGFFVKLMTMVIRSNMLSLRVARFVAAVMLGLFAAHAAAASDVSSPPLRVWPGVHRKVHSQYSLHNFLG